jgi:outer membrane murein-binding lipoprotein Lpp
VGFEERQLHAAEGHNDVAARLAQLEQGVPARLARLEATQHTAAKNGERSHVLRIKSS